MDYNKIHFLKKDINNTTPSIMQYSIQIEFQSNIMLQKCAYSEIKFKNNSYYEILQGIVIQFYNSY